MARKVHIKVCSARGLMPRDGCGSASPYCMVSFDGQQVKTQVRHRTLNPEWNETLDLNVEGDALQRSHVRVSVLNYTNRRPLGKIKIEGSEVPHCSSEPSDSEQRKYRLKTGLSCVAIKERGSLTLKLWWSGPVDHHEHPSRRVRIPAPQIDSVKHEAELDNIMMNINQTASAVEVHKEQCLLLCLVCKDSVEMVRGYAGSSELFLRRLRQFIRKANGVIRECSKLEEHWEWLAVVKYDRELEIEEIVEELHFMCGLIDESPIQAHLPEIHAVAQLDKAALEKQALDGKFKSHYAKYILERVNSSELPELNSENVNVHFGEMLGRGSYGVVRKGTWHQRLVAVKEFRESNLSSRELRAVSRIQAAPHIVQTIGYYKVDESCTHLVMEVMRMDLKEYASKNKGLTHLQLVEMLLQITKGLNFLHGKNIVHRDLKPENVLIDFTDEDEEQLVLKLADFGTAYINFNTELSHTAPIGTRIFMAPELQSEEIKRNGETVYSRSVDLYSLGMTFSQLVLSQPAIGTPTAELEALICRCSSEEPSERPVVDEVLKSLRNILRNILCCSLVGGSAI
ncbi:dual serine/threonine and tyrosine protein kinase-like [Selaginella moellendorffii]|uniref:dual serine/threonine and tyrosine protein kinase-like n=1 Tax=Selaginella moellendorffii TaxID=88036 RepID=UPI000D1C7318|nr:dual serine/threonine and tyrosine protein kinase-like [Selaginella moellendorffii]|eukprot:XP_024531943.1 dual serine/threonine and tyrosine protein kinase-like [Selaginella moellendorffii]